MPLSIILILNYPNFSPCIYILDIKMLSKLNGFTWGSIYENDMLNRIAIGRFIRELIDDITYNDGTEFSKPHSHSFPWRSTSSSTSTTSILSNINRQQQNNQNTAVGVVERDSSTSSSTSTTSILSNIKGLQQNNQNTAVGVVERDSKRNSSPLANILIYSGHDSTLVPLLCALGIYSDEWPPYATYVALEICEYKYPDLPNTATLGLGTCLDFI